MAELTDYAWLSAAAYRRQQINQIEAEAKGWTAVKIISDHLKDIGASSPDGVLEYSGADSGHFSAGVYTKGTEIVIAFTGTNTTLDEHLNTNIPAGLGVPTEQVRRALLLTLQTIQKYGEDNITFTGHSLGGGLASLMAMFFGKEAVVFDEAPFAMSAQRLGAVCEYWDDVQGWIRDGLITSDLPTGFVNYMNEMQVQKDLAITRINSAYGDDILDYHRVADGIYMGEDQQLYSWKNEYYKPSMYEQRFDQVSNYYVRGEILELLRNIGPGLKGTVIDVVDSLLDALAVGGLYIHSDYRELYSSIQNVLAELGGNVPIGVGTIGNQVEAIDVLNTYLSVTEQLIRGTQLHSIVLLSAVLESRKFQQALFEHNHALDVFFDPQLYGVEDLNTDDEKDFLSHILKTHVENINNNVQGDKWLDLIAADLNSIGVWQDVSTSEFSYITSKGGDYRIAYDHYMAAYKKDIQAQENALITALTEYWYSNPASNLESAFTALPNGVQLDLTQFASDSDHRGTDLVKSAIRDSFGIRELRQRLSTFVDMPDLIEPILERLENSTMITVSDYVEHSGGFYTNEQNAVDDFVWSYYGGGFGLHNTGDGNDTIIGGRWGGYQLYGGAGSDYLVTYGENNKLYGGADSDVLVNWAAEVTYTEEPEEKTEMHGEDGDDLMMNRGDYVQMYGGLGENDIYSWGHHVTIDGTGGKNLIEAVGNYTTIIGGDLGDEITTNGSHVVINAGNGENQITVGAKFSQEVAGSQQWGQETSSQNTVNGGSEKDKIYLIKGVDNDISGNEGDDEIYIGTKDQILSEASNNRIYGGTGDDTITVLGTNNEIYGGDGNDTIRIGEEKLRFGLRDRAENHVYGGQGQDTVYLYGLGNQFSGGEGNDTVYSYGGRSTLNGGAGVDTYHVTLGDFIGEADINSVIYYRPKSRPWMAPIQFNMAWLDRENRDEPEEINAMPFVVSEITAGKYKITYKEDTDEYFVLHIDEKYAEETLDKDSSPADEVFGNGADTANSIGPGWGDAMVDGSSVDTQSAVDFIKFTQHFTPDDISLERRDKDLVIYAKNESGSITVKDYFSTTEDGTRWNLQQIRFEGDVVWSRLEIDSKATWAQNDTWYGTIFPDVKHGGWGDDRLYGGLSNDVLYGDGGYDKLYGEDGDDVLYGGTQDDELYGGNGNDVLVGGTGNDYLEGGDGSDLYYFEKGWGSDTIYDGGDSSYADQSIDIIRFGDGIYSWDIGLAWLEGDYTLDNVLRIFYQDSNDSINVKAHFKTGSRIKGYGAVEQIQFADGTVWDYEMISQRALHTAQSNIYGHNANDELHGTAAADALYGAQGQDVLYGGQGDDVLFGEAGDDLLVGAEGNDWLSGGAGSDTYYFERGWGQDTVNNYDISANKKDVIRFGAGIAAADIEISRDGVDLVLMLKGAQDQVRVTRFFDYASSSYKLEEIQFADGTVWTAEQLAQGTVPFIGTEEGDISWGTTGDDLMYGRGGDDGLQGGNGNDIIYGEEGNDSLSGDAGDDVLIGGAGDDELRGGAGSDTYYFESGWGHDIIRNQDYLADQSMDTVQFGAGITAQDLTLTAQTNGDLLIRHHVTGDTITVEGHFRSFIDPYFSSTEHQIDVIRFADGTAWDVGMISQMASHSTAGDDIVLGSAGDDVLNGGAGNDILVGGAGSDTYYFERGWGQDVISNDDSGNSTDIIRFSEGIGVNDLRLSQNYYDLIIQLEGSDDQITVRNYFRDDEAGRYQIDEIRFADGTIWSTETIRQLIPQSTQGDDVIMGTSADDELHGLAGNDEIHGGAGNDRLFGDAGDDVLIGGDGDDYLAGGAGNDILEGGAGSDTYYFERGWGQDVINNWDNGQNKLDVIQFGAGISAQDIETLYEGMGGDGAGGHLILRLKGSTDQITIENYFNSWDESSKVDQIRFADGTVWTQTTIAGSALTIHGTEEGDYLNGSSMADNIYGGAGDDSLMGGDGNDLLVGGTGNDTLDGGAGNDIYHFESGWGQDYINNSDAGFDTIRFAQDISSGDIDLSRWNDDLVIRRKDSTDLIMVSGFFGEWMDPDDSINAIQFADGTAWDQQTIRNMVEGGGQTNQAPVTGETVTNQQGRQGEPFTLVLPASLFTDPDGDALTYSITQADGSALPGWLTYDAATRTLSGTPGNGDVGNFSLKVTATDPSGLSTSQDFTLHIENVNDAPYVTGVVDAVNAKEGNVFRWTLPAGLFADIDEGDVLSYHITMADDSALPSWLTFDLQTGLLSGTPPSGANGHLALQIIATDLSGATANANLDIAVEENANTAPVVQTPLSDLYIAREQQFNFTIPAGTFTDPDEDTLTYSARLANGGELPDWLSFDPATGTFQGQPDVLQDLEVIITANDGNGHEVSSALIINVKEQVLTGSTASTITTSYNAIYYEDSVAQIQIRPGAEHNYIVTGSTPNSIRNYASHNTFVSGDGNDYIESFRRVPTDAECNYVTIDAGDGDDQIMSNGSFNTFFGGAGNDRFVYAQSPFSNVFESSKLYGGDGVDQFQINGFSIKNLTVMGEDGNDQIFFNGMPISGGQSNSDNLFDGGEGNDLINIYAGGERNTIRGGSGDDIITVRSDVNTLLSTNNSIIDGGTGNDDMRSTGNNDDTYLFRQGDGYDIVLDDGGNDKFVFGEGIAADQLWFKRSGSNLEISLIGTDDKITISSWYSGDAYHIEQMQTSSGQTLAHSQIDALVSAMAAFAPPAAGQTSLTPEQQAALAPVIAANWQ
ncbi:calcium-binding protein [Saezia sanguinis]|uniref:calcium-binding protein n=1 Tax=Saezia sanguinis TaxID=1965230 RepID=UPI0030500A24